MAYSHSFSRSRSRASRSTAGALRALRKDALDSAFGSEL